MINDTTYVGKGNSLMSRFMQIPLHERPNLLGEITTLQSIRVGLIEDAKHQPKTTPNKKSSEAKVNQLSKLLQTLTPEQIANLKRSLTDV